MNLEEEEEDGEALNVGAEKLDGMGCGGQVAGVSVGACNTGDPPPACAGGLLPPPCDVVTSRRWMRVQPTTTSRSTGELPVLPPVPHEVTRLGRDVTRTLACDVTWPGPDSHPCCG